MPLKWSFNIFLFSVLCTWPIFYKAFHERSNTQLFLVLPAGRSPPSVWCKSSPAHRGLARVLSSDAPGTHSLYHSVRKKRKKRVSVYQLRVFIKHQKTQEDHCLFQARDGLSIPQKRLFDFRYRKRSLPSASVYIVLPNGG